jgi:hypothetical protein
MKRAEYVARMGEKKNYDRILVGNTKRKEHMEELDVDSR